MHKPTKPGPLILLLAPQSFFEAHLLIDELSRKDRKGPSFHVVVPSLVGYTFSGPPPRQGWTLQDTARLFDALMTQVLGFGDGYVAHGGDWGHVVRVCDGGAWQGALTTACPMVVVR